MTNLRKTQTQNDQGNTVNIPMDYIDYNTSKWRYFTHS